MKNKLSILLALLFLFCTAMTCCEDDGDRVTYQMTLVGIGEPEHLDNSGSTPCAPLTGTIPYQAYMLKIPLEFVSDEELIEAEYYDYVLNDTIATVQIISLNNYNASYPAGADVSELFIDYPIYQKNQLKDYSSRYFSGNIFYKIPRTLPDPGVHQFKIVVEMRSGKEFTKETDEIILQ